MHLQHTIKAVIRRGDQSGYVAECVEIPVVTPGAKLDEAVEVLCEGVAEMGLAANPTVVITTELESVHAWSALRVCAGGAGRFPVILIRVAVSKGKPCEPAARRAKWGAADTDDSQPR